MGDPRQLLSRTFGNRHMGSSHWHQDIRVTATAPGDIAKPFHHVPCKMAGLQALVGKHGHPQAEEEAKEGQQPYCLPPGGCLGVLMLGGPDAGGHWLATGGPFKGGRNYRDMGYAAGPHECIPVS